MVNLVTEPNSGIKLLQNNILIINVFLYKIVSFCLVCQVLVCCEYSRAPLYVKWIHREIHATLDLVLVFSAHFKHSVSDVILEIFWFSFVL